MENARGSLLAVGLCDPVESCAYTIGLRDHRRVSVSNLAIPTGSMRTRRRELGLIMGVLRKPFEIARDGSVIHHTNTGVRNIWGASYPRWRRATKRAPGSRTKLRHRLG